MKKIELGKTGILKRVLNSSVATALARAFRPISSKTLDESDSRSYAEELTEPYIHYDAQTRVRLQLLELERQKAEAVDLARRHAYM